MPTESFARLRLFGRDLDPQAVTDLIGEVPTKSHKKGEGRPGQVKRAEGYWSLESRRVRSTEEDPRQLELAAASLLECVGDVDPDAMAMAGVEYIALQLSFLFVDSEFFTPVLSPDALKTLHRLGASIEIGVAAATPEELAHLEQDTRPDK